MITRVRGSRKTVFMTKGSPFAYQVLRYLCYKDNKKYLDVIDDFELYLEEYIYEKIWNELSKLDKKVLKKIVKMKEQKTK